MKKEGTPKEVVALKSLLNVIDSTQQPEKFDTRFIIAVETAAAVAESISGKKIEGEIKLDLKSAIEKFKKVVSVMFEDVLKGIEDLDIDEWAKKIYLEEYSETKNEPDKDSEGDIQETEQ